ncbi:MAG: hypothetical protein OIN86_07295 [Candidatus Methanoperedens sp.]|nr:hypothetical protein [Candidatus Methanoperedens sp.]CAG0965027.1 hypothetical protein METP1_00924 [Methanosarcinales archaeon]
MSEYSHAPRIKEKNGYSTNWAGYAVTGSAGSVTDAKGSWIVNSITMVSNSGAIKAQPSTLSTDGTSFNVTWASAGP